MACHYLVIWMEANITSTKTPTELKNQIDQYLQNNGRILASQEKEYKARTWSNVDHSVEFDYYEASFRLKLDEDGGKTKAQIRQDMENFLNANFNIWQWKYHKCVHNESGNKDCPDTQAKNHSDPNDIPAEARF